MTTAIMRKATGLIGAPFGMRATSRRPFGPRRALCRWFARCARSLAHPSGCAQRAVGPSGRGGHCADGSLAALAHWRTLRDARNEPSALRAEEGTVPMVRSLRSLIGAPFGMRATSRRPFGPRRALCRWFARCARSFAHPSGCAQRAVGPSGRGGHCADGSLAALAHGAGSTMCCASRPQLEPSDQVSRFQMGTERFSVSMQNRAAANASSRWGAVATTTTALSPTSSTPTRCSSARRPRTGHRARASSATACSRGTTWLSYASYSNFSTPGRPAALSRAVPENRTRPPQSGRTAQEVASATGSGAADSPSQVSPSGGTRGASGVSIAVHRTLAGAVRCAKGAGGRRPFAATPLYPPAVPFDDDAEEGPSGFRPPPHPDDRLWRHPSEMRGHPIVRFDAPDSGSPSPAAPALRRPAPDRPGRRWLTVAAAGAAGAVAAGVLIVVLGLGQRVVERPVTQRVALNPVATAPGLTGGVVH